MGRAGGACLGALTKAHTIVVREDAFKKLP